jgi:hypothetical protein
MNVFSVIQSHRTVLKNNENVFYCDEKYAKPCAKVSRVRESRPETSGKVSRVGESHFETSGKVSPTRESHFDASGRLSPTRDALSKQKLSNSRVFFINFNV